MRQISILGCGWLGFPLAKSLLGKGFLVNGSTTSDEKIPLLQEAGINTFQISLHENYIEGNGSGFMENSEVLIVDIPPKIKGNSGQSFISKIRTLIPIVEKSGIQKLIFISSTSVFTDDNVVISSETSPNPETESASQLLQSEQLLQSNNNFQTTVIRFGGLIGEDRHPVYSLSGKKNIPNPDAPVNLIHQKDCIGIIQTVIENNIWRKTFHAVAPQHPSRQTYYTEKALVLNLPLPEFDFSKPSVGKTVLSEKIQEILGYEFQIKID